MQTKKLHELIEMAQKGEKFKAIHPKNNSVWEDKEFIQCETYNYTSIILDWEYQEIREPEVVEFVLDCTEKNLTKAVDAMDFEQYRKIKGKKWKFVCTEVMD